MALKLCPKCTYPVNWRLITDDKGDKYKVSYCSNKRCDYMYKRRVKK